MELDGGDGQIRSFRVSWERLLKRVLGVLGRVACGGLGELHLEPIMANLGATLAHLGSILR